MEKGKLKIYVGYFDGVGKTYSMQKDAYALLKEGIDVIKAIGSIDEKDEDEALRVFDFPKIKPMTLTNDNLNVTELDLDDVIYRKPQIVLINDLYHKNKEGCRNSYRYMDVIEILNNGIDVWTTLSILHLEGLQDYFLNNLNVKSLDLVPDYIFDSADDIVVVDKNSDIILSRFKENKIKVSNEYKEIYDKLLNEKSLLTLRELTFRRCADRLGKIYNSYDSSFELLVLISSSPSSEKLIHVASDLALTYKCKFTALYLKRDNKISKEDESNLNRYISLVKDLGGEVYLDESSDVINSISNYISSHSVRSLILGKSWEKDRSKNNFENKIISSFPTLEIFVIPSNIKKQSYSYRKKNINAFALGLIIISTILFISSLVTIIFNLKIGAILSLVSLTLIALSFIIYYLLTLNSYRNAKNNIKILEVYEKMLKATSRSYSDERYKAICDTVSTVLNKSVYFSINNRDNITLVSSNDKETFFLDKEIETREWVKVNKRRSGKATKSNKDARAIYYPIIKDDEVYGILGILISTSIKPSELILLEKITFIIGNII